MDCLASGFVIPSAVKMANKDEMKYRSQESESTDTGSNSSDTQSNGEKALILEPPPPKKRIATLLKKTTLCKHFLRGHCRFEDKCSYAHSADELQSKPNLTKTRMCANWLSGRCRNENCTYAHGTEEVQSTKAAQAKASETKRQEVAPMQRSPPQINSSVNLELSKPCKIQLPLPSSRAPLTMPPGLENELGSALPLPQQAYDSPSNKGGYMDKEPSFAPPWQAEPMKIQAFTEHSVPQNRFDVTKPMQGGQASKAQFKAAKKPGLQNKKDVSMAGQYQATNDSMYNQGLYELLCACEHAGQLSPEMQCTIAQLFMSDSSLALSFPGLYQQIAGQHGQNVPFVY